MPSDMQPLVIAPDLLPHLAVGAAALVVLVKSAGVVVSRLTAVAQAYDVPDVLIAMTVIAVGTSLPEIGSHVTASLGILAGSLDPATASATVMGGNMGSSTVQQALLVGLFLVAYGRFEFTKSFLRGTYVPMVLALGLTFVLAWDGTITRVDGLLLVGVYLVYLYYSYTRRQRQVDVAGTGSEHVRRDLAVAVVGLVGVLGSAFVVLQVVEVLVDALRLGGSMIGVFTIGLAAALPELSTVVESVRRETPYIALGTLFGSNVVNPLIGFGLGGMISTYQVPPPVVLWDLPFKILLGVGLLGYLHFVSNGALKRREGGYLIAAYFVFIAVRLVVFV